MMPPADFSTARLLLRAPLAADAEAIFHAYAQDPEITCFLIWRPHSKQRETEAFVARCIDAWQQGSEFSYVITERDTGRLLGMLALRLQGFLASLGYVLRRDAWGQGIMPEAAGAVTDWLLAQPGIYRVWATYDRDNLGSARVLEKVGMQREELMHRATLHPNMSDEPRDCWLYAQEGVTRLTRKYN